ncbi:glycoside hydrolase family 1 protein [Pseudarthrobacter sp. P1]|uniref:glycoside hydrolase family 1 protein n=1 Tax=Pseudarthrobacter sp. P1 TaxID=3418418 RepID=UPI003CF80A2A
MAISDLGLADAIPPDFTLGVATSAFQIEGAADADGRGPSGWDVFARQPGHIVDGHSPMVSCDHYHRMHEDVALIKALGADSYRFSLSWPRIQPQGSGPVNKAGLDFYDRLVDELLANDISPMVTLYHWETPLALDEAGGWMNRDTAYRLGDFADIAAQALGDRVRRWVTVNEPATVTVNGYALGIHAPGESLFLKALPTVHHQLLGHGLAVQALRSAGVPGEIGITNVYSPMVPASDGALDKISAGLMDAVQNRLFADPVLLGKYPALVSAANMLTSFSIDDDDLALISQPLDFYGLNYYMPTRVAAGASGDPVPEAMAGALGDLGETVPGALLHITPWPGAETTAYGWPIVPEYLSVALAELSERYPDLPPVFITEGGASFDDRITRTGDPAEGDVVIADEARIRYLADHIHTAIAATSAGGAAESIALRGYYVWSLLDNFEWQAGYQQPFGLVHVDFSSLKRTPKASYYWLQKLLSARRGPTAPDDSKLPAPRRTIG